MIKQFDVYYTRLDPTEGHEIKKTRPAIIISPDSLNNQLSTVIIIPLSTQARCYPFRLECVFNGKNGVVLLDHIRSVDKKRLGEKLGHIDKKLQKRIIEALQVFFES